MNEHTPGPFLFDGPSPPGRIHDDGGDYAIYIERDGEKHIIAEVFRRTSADNSEPARTNARLFAAAPALLKALTEVRLLVPSGSEAMGIIDEACGKAGVEPWLWKAEDTS